jgi:hypothetical protein
MVLKQGSVEALVSKLVKETLAEMGASTPEPKTSKAMGKVVGRTRANRPVYEGKLSQLPEDTPVEMGVARDGGIWARIPFGTKFTKQNGKLVLVK